MPTMLLLVGLLTALVFVGIILHRSLTPEAPPASGASGKFVLVDAAERGLDGAPALSLTFSQPLDPRTHYDRFIEVFEMPPRLGERRPPPDDPDAHDSSDAPAQRKKLPAMSTAAEDTAFDDSGGYDRISVSVR